MVGRYIKGSCAMVRVLYLISWLGGSCQSNFQRRIRVLLHLFYEKGSMVFSCETPRVENARSYIDIRLLVILECPQHGPFSLHTKLESSSFTKLECYFLWYGTWMIFKGR